MKKRILMLNIFFLSTSAFAYKDGTYVCKNAFDGMPKNTYRIHTISIAGESIPILEIHRFFKEGANGMREVSAKGVATVSNMGDNKEILSINQLSVQFDNDELFGCLH